MMRKYLISRLLKLYQGSVVSILHFDINVYGKNILIGDSTVDLIAKYLIRGSCNYVHVFVLSTRL